MALSKKELALKFKNDFGKMKDDYFDFEKIEKYFLKTDNSDAYQVVSDRTCQDLNFDELFQFLDRTTSRIGQQYLYKKLRVIDKNKNAGRQIENLSQLYAQNESLRFRVRKLLMKLNHTNAYYITTLFQDEYIKQPVGITTIRLLSFTSLVSALLIPFFFPAFFIFLLVFITNLVVHYMNKKILYQYTGSVPQLLRLYAVSRGLMKQAELEFSDKELEESVKAIEGVKNRMSYFQLEAKLDTDLASIAWAMLELVKIMFLLEPLILYNILKHLDSTRTHIHNLFRFIGMNDMAISIASLRYGLPVYCHPEILQSGKKLEVEKVYHPLISGCVPNSLTLENRSILITGSNMSGKTTFIRTIGVNAVTALTLNTCFAEKFVMPELKIYSAIRISDDLMNDKSYYFEEVLTIKDMLKYAGDYSMNLFLLDEIYKGTNTVERIAAGKAVLSKLNINGNFVFVSTHDIELAELLQEEYDLYNFSEKVDEGSIGFDFKLKPGKLTNRNAISILQLNDYPTDLISEARSLAAKLDRISAINKLSEDDASIEE